jgi:chromosome segregation ATPase
MVVAVVTAGVISSVFGESTVVLKSGETLQGNIIFDTNDILRIEAHNANRTISYQRDISHDEIQSIQTDNPAQAAERADYEALSKFQLNPNQEQSIDYCSQVITAFQKFLTDYPKSDKSPAIQQRLGAWQSELKHVSDGEVKFGDKWMTPEEKQPLVEHWQKQMQVQAAQNTLESLKKQLRILQTKRDSLAESTAAAQGLLQAAQDQIKTLRDSQQPIYQTTTQPFQPYRDGQGHWIVSGPAQSSQSIVGYTTVPNPERATLQSEVSDYQRQVYSGPQALENLDAKIKVLEIQIPKAEQDCKIALAQLNPRPPPPSLPIVTQVVAKAELPPQPTPPPPTTAPPEPKPEPTSWYTRLWKWL